MQADDDSSRTSSGNDVQRGRRNETQTLVSYNQVADIQSRHCFDDHLHLTVFACMQETARCWGLQVRDFF